MVLVVLFHFWPNRVPGGYVGVDVFFVVSGFLITGHILREVAADGRVRLSVFWARRARRLLPASMLVCAASIAATSAWAPRALWPQFFKEILASVLYVQNWVLAGDSVDYLGAENTPSPVQHFWSLAIEEQFYLVWPVMIALVVAAAARRPRWSPTSAVTAVISAVCLASLVVSVVWTWSRPASAYFASPTRVWEFGAGGLLAIAVQARPQGGSDDDGLAPRVRHVATVVGLTMIVWSAFAYGAGTMFPGWAAAVPVVGTLLVVGVGPHGMPGVLRGIADHSATQWVGDVSYSLYLWHWPVIVFAPFVLDGPIGRAEKLVMIVLSFALAAGTKYFVEDPVRWNRRISSSARLTYVLAAVAMVVVGGVGAVSLRSANHDAAAAVEEAEVVLQDASVCLGADVMLAEAGSCTPATGDELVPRPVALKQDTGGAYSCYEADSEVAYEQCSYGSTAPDATRVAVVGDSHAAALLPGLWDELDRVNWSLDTFVGRGCVWMATIDDDPTCRLRQGALQELFESGEPYDAIIITASRNERVPDGQDDPRSERLAAAWRTVIDRGIPVFAVTDNPLLPDATVDCLTSLQTVSDAPACTMPREIAMAESDAMPRAVELAGNGAHLIETERAFCVADECPLVIGNVIVYRDRHHITATFSRTLAPYLVDEITAVLETAR